MPKESKKPRIGAHVPTTGGMAKRSIEYAQEIGASAIQVFGTWAPIRGFLDSLGIGLPYGNCDRTATLNFRAHLRRDTCNLLNCFIPQLLDNNLELQVLQRLSCLELIK